LKDADKAIEAACEAQKAFDDKLDAQKKPQYGYDP